MKNYTFKIENPLKTNIYFNVVAKTRVEAVEIANLELADAEEDTHGTLFLSPGIPRSTIVLNAEFKAEEKFITGESEIEIGDLVKAYHLLIERGYYYCENDVENLSSDMEPTFTKPIFTEEGSEPYAFFEVSALFDHNLERYTFYIEADLYPIKLSTLKEDGQLNYGVCFRARQTSIPVDELEVVLEMYEEKFINLIKALRCADPFDGLALPEDELV